MELTQKFKIYPTEEQEDVSWILSEKCRLVYNFFLADKIKVYEETGVNLTYNMQQSYLPKYYVNHSKMLSSDMWEEGKEQSGKCHISNSKCCRMGGK